MRRIVVVAFVVALIVEHTPWPWLAVYVDPVVVIVIVVLMLPVPWTNSIPGQRLKRSHPMINNGFALVFISWCCNSKVMAPREAGWHPRYTDGPVDCPETCVSAVERLV